MKALSFRKSKVAILGTSLPSMFLAEQLVKEGGASCVTLFENGELGGAWGARELSTLTLPKHNNVIVPYSKRQERSLGILSGYLRSRGAVIRPAKFPKPGDPSTQIDILTGHFFPVIQSILQTPKITLSRKAVSNIFASKKEVQIDDESFDFCFITNNSNPNRIDFYSNSSGNFSLTKESGMNLETSVSHHLRILLPSSVSINNLCNYSERPYGVFDRWGFIPSKIDSDTGPLFIGRVSRQNKGLSLEELISQSCSWNEDFQKIKAADLIQYSQSRVDNVEALVRRISSGSSRLRLLENRDFMTSVEMILSKEIT